MNQAQEAEVQKYIDAYAHTGYGMGPARKQAATRHIEDWLSDNKKPDAEDSPTLIDVGCGRGEMLDIAKSMGFNAKGYDPATCEYREDVFYGLASDIPAKTDSANLVTCFDVMEHLLEDDLIPALRELRRVSQGAVIIAAADFPHYGAGGVNYHISMRSNDEWYKLFKRVFEHVRLLPRYGGISATWQCTGVAF